MMKTNTLAPYQQIKRRPFYVNVVLPICNLFVLRRPLFGPKVPGCGHFCMSAAAVNV
jgi:hypothetical protein